MKKGPFIGKSLTYIGLPLLLCILLLLVLSFVLANQRTMELNNLETRSQLQATLFAEKISGKLNALEILLDSLAKQSNLMDLSKQSNEEILEHTVREDQLIFSEIEGVFILDSLGNTQYTSLYHESEGLNALRSNLIKLHIEQQFTFHSLPFIDKDKHYLSLSRSIEDASGAVVRIVSLIIHTDLFHEQMNLTSIPGLEQLLVSDAEDTVVAFWTNDVTITTIPKTLEDIYPAYMEKMPTVQKTSLRAGIRSYANAGNLYTAASLAGFPYTLTLKHDIQMAMASYDKALIISFSFLLMMVLISGISITRLGFEVTKKEAEQAEILDSLAHKVQERTLALKQISEQDTLTGLPNRRKINALLTTEIGRCKFDGSSFSLLILDIDHFKLVNDTFGHQQGDEVILAIVDLLSPIIEGGGTLARWGGDELMALFPNYTLQESVDRANAMRLRIESASFIQNIHITLSIGVTQFIPEDTDTALIRRADIAMYRAKEAGRNQVQIG